MVLSALPGDEEGGVDGRVSLKRFGRSDSSDPSEPSELSPPSGVLRISCSSPSLSVLRGILSCRSSAAILNTVHALLAVTTPPMVGPTWPRVRSTLGSDCLPVLSQGTASLRLWTDCLHCYRAHPMSRDWGCTSMSFPSCLCGPEGYIFDHMYVHFHGSVYPMMDCTLRV